MPESPAKDDHETAPEDAKEPAGDETKHGAENVQGREVDEDQGQDSKLQGSLLAAEGEAWVICWCEDTGSSDGIAQVRGGEVLDNWVMDVCNCLSDGLSSEIVIQ